MVLKSGQQPLKSIRGQTESIKPKPILSQLSQVPSHIMIRKIKKKEKKTKKRRRSVKVCVVKGQKSCPLEFKHKVGENQ